MIGVIDVGSNTIKMLLGTRGPDGRVRAVDEETLEVRISGGMGKGSGRLRPEHIAAGVEAVAQLFQRARNGGAGRVAIVATAAVRTADNGSDFVAAVQRETGQPVTVLTGEQEARWIALGVTQDPALAGAAQVRLLDLGGGSLELIALDGGRLRVNRSLPLGAVRLTEEFLADAGASVAPGDARRIRETIRQRLESDITGTEWQQLREPSVRWVGTGGAFTFIRLILARRAHADLATFRSLIRTTEIAALSDEVCALNLAKRQAIPGLPAARADIFPVALLTLVTALEACAVAEITHSFFNLRFGVAAELLDQPG